MKYDRTRPWIYSVDDLMADLPKWRRELIAKRFDEIDAQKRHHAGSAAYWHRRAVAMMMIERDRTKHIEALEQQVLST